MPQPPLGHDVEQTGERAERKTRLPEFKLTAVTRSEAPINQEGEAIKKIEVLRPWHNYSIIILENPKQIKILDENGDEVQDFTTPVSNASVEIDIQSFIARAGKRFLGDNTQKHPLVLNVNELPQLLQRESLEIIKRFSPGQWTTAAESIPSQKIKLHRPDVRILENGRYVVVGNKHEAPVIGFVTENNAGVVQAPRDWKRFDITSPDIPQYLVQYIESCESLPGEYRDISNEKYTVLVTDVGINIVSKDKPNDAPLFSDTIPNVGQNIINDPVNPNVIYYCSNNHPKDIVRLDLSGDPSSWAPTTAELPKKYGRVNNLQLDPSGTCFLFYSEDDLVIITKDTLEEVKQVPKLTQVNFDEISRIRAVDQEGHLVIYETNFDELAQELDKERVARLAQGVSITDIFQATSAARAKKGVEGMDHLIPLREKYAQDFAQVLGAITTLEGANDLRRGTQKLRGILKNQRLKDPEIAFILEGLEAPILDKEKEFGARKAQEILKAVHAKLAGGLSIAVISEVRGELDGLKSLEPFLDEDARRELREATTDFDQKSLELFRQRGGEIIKDVQGILARTRGDLEAFKNKADMDDWMEFRYPQLKSRLGSLAHDCPLEADEAYKAIALARAQLQELATEFEEKFKHEYALIREKASERIGAVVDTLEADIAGLIERLRAKGFMDRDAAEQYLSGSEARRALDEEIAVLASGNPDAAKELERALKVKISNMLTEIERGALTKVAETGQQLVAFGKTYFPRWEQKVKERTTQTVEIAFAEDQKTHGPGVQAGEVLGDVSIIIKTSNGKTEKVRLFEGLENESEWRLGLLTYRGEALPPSYVTAKDYREIRSQYADWSRGADSSLRKEYEAMRASLHEVYARRQKRDERTPEAEESFKREYRDRLKKYATFCAENHISLLRRIDKLRSEPAIEHTNGKGYVPEWASHWVVDSQTERDLETMAMSFKMQMDLQEGLLNLKGHAGTGKDVRIKMFCGLTNRPYFGIDCTKWTTEFELSEDVVLESEDGASQTVKVPSAVLNGITTPGALVYFNEFNAMPEQAQIFLHALMDEKRSLTLKTSSGKVIRAHPSVLLAASMNPGYPGTFEPQFATRSRMDEIEIGYPPLTRKPDAGDTNPNVPYDASEPLRIARGVDSLADLTYEANLERNEFVRMWDKYVNGIDNGAEAPAGEQKFDVDTILALTQFGNTLRENFIKFFEKSSKTSKARQEMPVSQPLTGRELRRAAYALSQMTAEEKATANPEGVARELLERYFLIHIDNVENKDKIRTAMATWTSKKRVAV